MELCLSCTNMQISFIIDSKWLSGMLLSICCVNHFEKVDHHISSSVLHAEDEYSQIALPCRMYVIFVFSEAFDKDPISLSLAWPLNPYCTFPLSHCSIPHAKFHIPIPVTANPCWLVILQILLFMFYILWVNEICVVYFHDMQLIRLC